MNLLTSLNYIPVKRYQPETLDYKNRILANGGAISSRSLDAIEKFIQDCKEDSIWNLLIEVAPFAGDNLNAALVKLRHAGASTLLNFNFVSGDYIERGPTAGLLGDGATKYLSSGFSAQSLPDNSHLSFYLRDDLLATGNRAMAGALAGSDQYWLGSLTPASSVDVRLGQSLTANASQPLTKGFYIGNRAASNNLRLHRNAALIGTNLNLVTHTKPAQNISLWAFNSNGTPAAFLPARGSFFSIGYALTDSQAALLHAAVQTLQTNLERPV
ncbi:MAG: hypothetical protein SFY81_02110 [Verrucomicrobiota bacterium]|nr:hypothetical protein [Verrucomicrobiota bacterium]